MGGVKKLVWSLRGVCIWRERLKGESGEGVFEVRMEKKLSEQERDEEIFSKGEGKNYQQKLSKTHNN